MQRVSDTGALVVIPMDDPPGIAVRGDLGSDHVNRFARALRESATEHTEGGLYLDCAGLHTVSIDGLRAVMDAAVDLSHGGRTLTVQSLSPYFHRIFRLAGWDETPGLILATPAPRTSKPAGKPRGTPSAA